MVPLGPHGSVEPSLKLAERVRELALRVGFSKASKLLGCHREAVARIIAKMPVRAGTIVLVEQSLDVLGGI
jgi:hypothetical protein